MERSPKQSLSKNYFKFCIKKKKSNFIDKNFNSNVNFLHTIQFLNFTKISNLLSSTPYQNSWKSFDSAPAERNTTPILKRKKKMWLQTNPAKQIIIQPKPSIKIQPNFFYQNKNLQGGQMNVFPYKRPNFFTTCTGFFSLCR